MGQTKKLLDDLYELDFVTADYPEDLDRDYELWLEERKEVEREAYEQHLSDTYKTYHNE